MTEGIQDQKKIHIADLLSPSKFMARKPKSKYTVICLWKTLLPTITSEFLRVTGSSGIGGRKMC